MTDKYKEAKITADGLTYFLLILSLIFGILCFIVLIYMLVGDDLKIGITSILSLALLAITGFYAYFTWLMKEEMKKARLPFVTLSLNPLSPMHFNIRLVNSGNGTASNVRAEFWIDNQDDSKRKFRVPVMLPGDHFDFFVPISSSDRSSFDKLVKIEAISYKIRYDDPWGHMHPNENKLFIGELLELWKESNILYLPNPLEQLKKVTEELEKISIFLTSKNG